jgi:quercetin dioxygenase-like cupin family protein
MASTVARNRGEGQALWVLNGLYEVKASSDETGGELTAMEMTIPEGAGPPPHTHPGGEAVYVIEGRVRYHIADKTYEGGPGAFFYVPQGVWENFEPAEGTVRVLVMYTPGGMDKFFNEVGEPAQKRELPPASATPPDVDRLISVGAKYGVAMRRPAGV